MNARKSPTTTARLPATVTNEGVALRDERSDRLAELSPLASPLCAGKGIDVDGAGARWCDMADPGDGAYEGGALGAS
jgi:hypothetical protein